MSKRIALFLLVVIASSFAVTAFASPYREGRQNSAERLLEGKVVDPSGAVITGAEISVSQSDGTVISRLVSNEQGMFSVKLLEPGKYSLEVSHPGFERITKSIEVDERKLELLTLTMTIPAQTTSVVVAANQRDTEYTTTESATASKCRQCSSTATRTKLPLVHSSRVPVSKSSAHSSTSTVMDVLPALLTRPTTSASWP